jgi:hypothetical protein
VLEAAGEEKEFAKLICCPNVGCEVEPRESEGLAAPRTLKSLKLDVVGPMLVELPNILPETFLAAAPPLTTARTLTLP